MFDTFLLVIWSAIDECEPGRICWLEWICNITKTAIVNAWREDVSMVVVRMSIVLGLLLCERGRFVSTSVICTGRMTDDGKKN
jgi:hypothetical protein